MIQSDPKPVRLTTPTPGQVVANRGAAAAGNAPAAGDGDRTEGPVADGERSHDGDAPGGRRIGHGTDGRYGGPRGQGNGPAPKDSMRRSRELANTSWADYNVGGYPQRTRGSEAHQIDEVPIPPYGAVVLKRAE